MWKVIRSAITVIVCVSAIVLVLLPPQMNRTHGSPAATTMSRVKLLSTCMLIYTGEYDDHLPYVQTTRGAYESVRAYMKWPKGYFASLNPNKTHFEFNLALAGVQISKISDGDNIPIWYESGAWPARFRIIGTMTGRAKKIKVEEWPEIEATFSRRYPRHGKPLPAELGVGKWKF